VTSTAGFDDNQGMADKVTTVHADVEQPMKVVGRRRWAQGLVAAAPLLRLVLDLRGAKPFLPRGVHRFRTFEESEAWTLRMLARPPKPGRRS
jgi:hypothetical protein